MTISVSFTFKCVQLFTLSTSQNSATSFCHLSRQRVASSVKLADANTNKMSYLHDCLY